MNNSAGNEGHVPARQQRFEAGLAEVCHAVFGTHPDLRDDRDQFPWLTGALGDPFTPVWFVAENPSLTQVRKLPAVASPDVQWSASPGDRLFREALTRNGFKTGSAFSPGGWRCYITDVIKSASVAKEWRKSTQSVQRQTAEAWAPALTYELEHGEPHVLVVLGEKAKDLLAHLECQRLVPRLPPRRVIYHYSYLGSRPESGGLRRPKRDPGRISEWDAEFASVAADHSPPA